MKRLKLLIVIVLTSISLTAQVGRELYRPTYHYSPNFNWMSDPNGLVFYNGKYHMFYQYNPLGIQPANMSWGHAVSKDMLIWEEKPVAIPVQNGVQAYSGSVVVDWKNTSGFGINGKPPMIAIYTGASNVQDQRIAYSNDEGDTWTTYSQNPVISSNNKQFRDPKVFWHEPTQKWIMVVSTGEWKKIHFYSSPNLKNWTFHQDIGLIENQSGYWECPDFFKLPVDNDTSKAKWVLMHSVTPNAQYFIGDYDGKIFNWEKKEPTGILIDDFETSNYNGWTITGSAFGTTPADGKTIVSGYRGSKLTNTFLIGSGALGKMVSADFTIEKNYISFLLGGGYHPGKAYIKLVVNGKTVQTSTGLNENILKWRNWDVASFIGQIARIEIVDSVTGRWGHINVDHIIQSDVMTETVNYGQLDYGKDFYATQSFSDMPDGRRVWIGWLNNWSYAAQVPTSPWKGIMSIPREVKLETFHDGLVKLVQKPIEELKALRSEGLNFNNKRISQINNSLRNVIGTALSTPTFKQFELKAKVSVNNKNGFSLKFKKSGLQYGELIFDFINKEIIFDRSRIGGPVLGADPNFKDVQVAPLIIENGFIDLQLFVDNSSVELFTAGGKVVMSNLIFPDSTSNKIELSSFDDDFSFEEFNIWKLEKRAYVPNPVAEDYSLFKVYPNPVINNNGITIKIKEEKVGKVIFSLFNTNGMLITEFQPTSNSIIIPRNKLSSSKGLYFLKGSDGLVSQTEKLLILGY